MSTVRDALVAARQGRRRIFFRPGLGNAGDALIAGGFYDLVEQLGLEVTELPGGPLAVPELSSDDLLVLSGGSWLASQWDFGTRVIDCLTRFDAPLLLLPSSLHGNEGALRRLRPQDTLFTRERYSHEFARSLRLDARVELDHDMAFHLDADRWRRTGRVVRPRRRTDVERVLGLARLRALAARHGTLTAWRVDAESSGAHPQARWRDDLSLVADFGTLDRASIERSAGWLLRAISWFRRVETDRLHVGIGAALLGIPARIHANNYYKIRGIYEYSLRTDPQLASLVTFAG